jgi:hypothetical protein
MVRTDGSGGLSALRLWLQQNIGYCNNSVTSGDVTYDASVLRATDGGLEAPRSMCANHLRNMSYKVSCFVRWAHDETAAGAFPRLYTSLD